MSQDLQGTANKWEVLEGSEKAVITEDKLSVAWKSLMSLMEVRQIFLIDILSLKIVLNC